MVILKYQFGAPNMHVAQSLTALRLDSRSPAPMFRQLYDAIKKAILAGTLGAGTQLPPTRELSALLGISRQTVLNAYAQLTAEGFLAGTVGRGTFVSDRLPLPAAGKPAKSGSPVPLRPLSARGQCFTGEAARLNTHSGMPRAFRIGMPGLDVFPFDVWARLEARRWRRPQHHLGYDDPAGFLPLREAIAAYLRTSRGVQCDAQQVVITSGSQQAVFLIASLLLDPEDAAWVEEPGYRGINASLRAAGVCQRHVPIDEEGLCVSYAAKRFPDARLVYVTPSHQLPLGVTMSLQRRLELLAWAAQNKAWVVEDDYDSEYRYTGPPLASMQSLDKAGCVIYTGTLSKVLFPGLRLGYMVLPPALVDAFVQGKAIIDRHTATVPQMVLTDFINEGHFSRHIKRTREVYAERRHTLLAAMEHHLPDEFDIGSTDAGLHFAVAFRTRRDDRLVVNAASERGIELRALSSFYNAPQASRDIPRTSGLLLGFAAVREADLKRGVAELRDMLSGL
jgi:GntR family transcriptional regulator/MocR family aminotransferase